MRNRSKRLAGLVAVAAASLLAVAACSGEGGSKGGGGGTQYSPGFAECATKPNDCNSGPRANGGTMTFINEQDMAAWHPNAASGTHFASTQVLQLIYRSPFIVYPDYTLKVDTDLMTSVEMTKESPQTVVYKINPQAVWSDGTPVSTKDFLYNLWTFDGTTCKDCTPATTSGFELIKDAVSSDNDKTLTVTFSDPYPDWKGLFQLLPAHIAQKNGGWNGTKEDAAGLAKSFDYLIKTVPTWSNGPYLIDKFEKGVAVTQVPNPKWYGKEKPSLEKLIWRYIPAQSALIPALRNKEANASYPQPNADLVTQIKGLAPSYQYYLSPGLSWEHFDLNAKNKALSDKALRQAIYTAIDRQEIISKTVGVMDPTLKPLGNQVFMPGMKGYKDLVSEVKQGAGNVEAAKKILTDAGYKVEGDKLIGKDGQPVPQLRFRHTVGNKLRADTAALVQQQLKKIGLDIKIEPTDTLSKTLSTGDYDMMIFAWVTSPLVGTNLQDLWGSKSGQNYNKYNNPEYDKIAAEAAKTVDETKFNDMVNQGLKLLNEDAITLPIFQRLNLIVVDTSYVNVRNNGTNQGPAYNAHMWGTKQAA